MTSTAGGSPCDREELQAESYADGSQKESRRMGQEFRKTKERCHPVAEE